MPEPDHTLRVPGRPRRQVLRWAGAAAAVGAGTTLTGCRLRLEGETVTTPAPPTPDELARDRAVADAERLLGLLDDVRRLRPDATSLLGRVATEHEQHLAALRLPPVTTTPTTKPSAKPTTSASPSVGPTLAAATALGALAEAESTAARRTRQDLGDVSGDLARLLSGIASSQDCHADALTAKARSSAS